MIREAALVLQLAGAPPADTCPPAPSAPALDHVITVVGDLDRGSAAFRDAGFRIKPGRPHANGLLNAHIKFRDGSEIELMTVRGAPGDDLARRYASLLREGEGGVFVALAGAQLARVERAAMSAGLASRRSSSGLWLFLGFPDSSPAAAIFFTFGGAAAVDADSIFEHASGVTRLDEVWLEGGREVGDFLGRLGATSCGTARGPDGREGRRWGLRRGSVVIVPPPRGARPRVLGVVLDPPVPREEIVRPLPTFWIRRGH